MTNGKLYSRDTQKSILSLLKMTESMASTSVRVLKDKKNDVNFKNIPGRPSHILKLLAWNSEQTRSNSA